MVALAHWVERLATVPVAMKSSLEVGVSPTYRRRLPVPVEARREAVQVRRWATLAMHQVEEVVVRLR